MDRPDPADLSLEPDERFRPQQPPPPSGPRPRLIPGPANLRALPPERLRSSPLLLMAEPVYQEILATLTWPPESFALLLGPKDQDSVVTHFHFDANGDGTAGSFTADHPGLNDVLRRCVPAKLDCKGFAHTHPPGYDHLSSGDFAVVRALFAKERNQALQRFLMPIVVSGRLLPYVVFREDLDEGLDYARYAQLVLF